MAVQITGAAIPPIVFPCGVAVSGCTGNFKSAARDIGSCQKVDQMRVNRRAMRVMAVDAGSIIIKDVESVGERIIAVKAAGIMAFDAKTA